MPAADSRRLVALGLAPGDEFIAALEQAWARGDAVLPIDPVAPAAVTARLLDAMQPDEPVDEGVALIIATSGSTGEPKGVQLTHAALEASARATHDRIGIAPDDRWLSCLPWHHIGGLQVMLRSRLLGIPLTVHDGFDVERFAATDATLTSLVPTQLARLLDAGVDLARFRAILLGGAAAPVSLLDRAMRASAPVVTTYGMSETAGGCVYDGRPLDGVEVRCGVAGRIELRGPMLMNGYRLRPDLDTEALRGDWLITADIGQLDERGLLHVTGRVDDVVISGGENVVTSQVAAVIATHPDIAAAAVVGVADVEWGERIVAAIVPKDAGQVPSLPDLRDWCGDRLPPAARPRGVVVLDAIPMLSSGKPDRLAISQLVRDRSGDDSS